MEWGICFLHLQGQILMSVSTRYLGGGVTGTNYVSPGSGYVALCFCLSPRCHCLSIVQLTSSDQAQFSLQMGVFPIWCKDFYPVLPFCGGGGAENIFCLGSNPLSPTLSDVPWRLREQLHRYQCAITLRQAGIFSHSDLRTFILFICYCIIREKWVHYSKDIGSSLVWISCSNLQAVSAVVSFYELNSKLGHPSY